MSGRDSATRQLNVLIWRPYGPAYEFPATFSCLTSHSIGGTCSQLLWHAQQLCELGHHVQVLGVSAADMYERGIDFVGARGREEQEAACRTGRVRKPDIAFLEGSIPACQFLKSLDPAIKTVHVGQNIDRYGAAYAFRFSKWIDLYAMVGVGQLAKYSLKRPDLRHKFVLIRNITSFHSPELFARSQAPIPERVLWVGHWKKRGLTPWAETMAIVLAARPQATWVLCGPRYDSCDDFESSRYLFSGLRLPTDRVTSKHLPLPQLAAEIGSAQVVIVSLANECGPISSLDAHALGKPVVSGNDVIYKFHNPEGTGIRVRTGRERREALLALLANPRLCESMGVMGRQFVAAEYSATQLRQDLQRAVTYLQLKDILGPLADHKAATELQETVLEYLERAALKWRRVRTKRPTEG